MLVAFHTMEMLWHDVALLYQLQPAVDNAK
jgi:hypothetical protein